MGIIIDFVKEIGIKAMLTKRIVFTDEDMFVI